LTNRAIPHYSGHQQTHYTNHYNQKHSGFHSGYQSSNQTSHLVSYQSSNKSTHMNYNQISINYGECQAFNGTDHNTYYSTHYNFDDLVHHV
jgi:Tfp pilus assembly protein PilX